jgi:hypothetical protein
VVLTAVLLLLSDAVSLNEWFPALKRIMLPSCSAVKQPKKNLGDGGVILRNVRDYSPIPTAPHIRRPSFGLQPQSGACLGRYGLHFLLFFTGQYHLLLTYSLTHIHIHSLTLTLLTHLPTHTLSYVLTYLLTHTLIPWSTVLPENLTGSKLVKKFPAFYGTRRFDTVLHHKGTLSFHIQSQINPFHALTSYLLKIYLHIIPPSRCW